MYLLYSLAQIPSIKVVHNNKENSIFIQMHKIAMKLTANLRKIKGHICEISENKGRKTKIVVVNLPFLY